MSISRVMVRIVCAAAVLGTGATAAQAREAAAAPGKANLHRSAAATEMSLASAARGPTTAQPKMICGKYSVPGYMIQRKVCKTRDEWIELGAEFRKKN